MAPGAESPSLRSHHAVVDRYLAAKGTGPAGQTSRWQSYHAAKALAAQLLGLPGEESIAYVSSVADGMNALSHALPAKAGDNVVVEDVEFGSVLYPWLHLERHRVDVRLVRQAEWDRSERAYLAAVDAHTRAVVVSQVSYLTGLHHNVEALAEIAHDRGAWLVLDATHAAGAVPVPGELCDFVLTACYKWLLGWHGVALMGWNRQWAADVEPVLLGWRSPAVEPDRDRPKQFQVRPDAARFETGNPSYVGIFVLEDALQYLLGIGLDRVAEHDRRLSGMLNRGLREMGLDVATPLEPADRAGNTCFWHRDADALAASLAEAGIWVSAGEGRVRIGTHLWCSEADVATTVGALQRALSGAQ